MDNLKSLRRSKQTISEVKTEQQSFFTLSDLVHKAKNKIISLPTVQRGFVWKPYQIEDLWDSLLRGYPIGAFVLSYKSSFDKNEFELLDGQQRASAICLGFYNPINEFTNQDNNIFKTSFDNIMVFIDLLKPDSQIDNRKYLFRVITKSHPWGYRRQENQKILEAKDRIKAMNCYQLEDNNYFKKSLKLFWPYDSYEPIPFGLFINADNLTKLKTSISEWRSNVHFTKEKTKIMYDNITCYKVEDIFNETKQMLSKQQLPLLFLEKKHWFIENTNSNRTTAQQNEDITLDNIEDTEQRFVDEDQGIIEDRNISEVENLFIRLNRGGTPLRGDELNYSVLKAHITRELQDKIEEKSKGLFYPARFITIAFRLFNNISVQDDISDRDSIRMKIKPKQFQRLMCAKDKNIFITFLDAFLDSKYLDVVKQILIYHPQNNLIGLPKFIVYSIADKSPEIMFMLLYRLLIKRDEITEANKHRVLGLITLFIWLGKGEKQKDHGKLLENIWPCVKKYGTEKYWSSETIQRAMIADRDYQIMTPFPNLKSLKQIIPTKDSNIISMTFERIYESEYGAFIEKIFYNKDLILYAQRAALSKWFHELDDFVLEDTNRPFDYDHICPSSYTHNKKNIHRALKDWYFSIGNFRAWPFSLNRGDQDDSPAIKLNSEEVLNSSFCNNDWLKLEEDIKRKIKDNSTAKQIINCILNRNKEICLEWYDKLKIDDLVPTTPKKNNTIALLESVIKRTHWNDKEKEGDRLTYYLPVGEENIYLYFSFDTEEFSTLIENNIYFGIWENGSSETIRRIKASKKLKEMISQGREYYETSFTLITYNDDSVNDLFRDFFSWLQELRFPAKEAAINKFKNSIKNERRDKIIKRQ